MDRFAKFAWGVLAWTVLDVLWGAFVRASRSGTGCGSHWPACNGQVFPAFERIETAIEFSHRALSGVLLLLVLALLVWGWRRHAKGSPVRIGLAGSTLFLLLEAGIGASLVLVGRENPLLYAAIVAVHLLNTFTLLAFVALTAWWASGGQALSLKNSGSLPVWIGLGLGGVALLGMTGAITAQGDTLFPAQSLAHGLAQDADPNANILVRLRVVHPLLAVFVAVYSLHLARRIYGTFNRQATRQLSLLLGGLVLAQVTAGVVNLLLLAPIWMQLIHLLLADSLWISYVLLSAATLSKESEQERQ